MGGKRKLVRGQYIGIYDRHCTGPGSTFSLYLKGGKAEALRLRRA